MGAKSGGQPTVSTYYTDMLMVCCAGPIDKVTRIFGDGREAWVGESTGADIEVNSPDLYGGPTREGGLIGTVQLGFGGPTQVANAYLESQLGPIPAYRNLFTTVWKETYIGNNYYMKPLHIEAQRIHVEDAGLPRWYDATSELSSNYNLNFTSITKFQDPDTLENFAIINTFKGHGINEQTSITVSGADDALYNKTFFPTEVEETTVKYALDSLPAADATGNITVSVLVDGLMNAVHIVRECLTNTMWGYGYSETLIDETSFAASALTCFNEGLGFSFFWEGNNLSEFIVEVLEHINGNLYQDRVDGKFYLTLLRKIDDINGLPILDDVKISNIESKSLGELTTTYTVKFFDNQTGKTNTTTVSDPALYQKQGIHVVKSKTYNGVVDLATAHKLAVRDALILKLPLYSCTIETNTVAENFNKGDAFILSNRDFLDVDLVFRVVDIDLGDGTSRRVVLNCIQDSFHAADIAYKPPTISKWVNPINAPRAAINRLINELPYYIAATVNGDTWAQGVDEAESYIVAAAEAPTSDSFSAGLWASTATNYTRGGAMDFCFYTTLNTGINKTDTTVLLEDITDIVLLTINHFIQIDEELMEVTNISGNSLTVVRGVMDTVPESHLANAEIYAWHDYSHSNEVTYFIGESVNVKLTPITPQGELAVAIAPIDIITIAGRMHMPYPPGNFKINGNTWPATATNGNVTLSWAHRNRLQQTAGLIGYYTSDITTEIGVTYAGNVYRTDTNAVIASFTGETGNSVVVVPTVSGDSELTATHTVVNGNAETGTTSGWTAEVGSIAIKTAGAAFGTYYFSMGTHAVSTASSTTVDLIADGVLAAEIDADNTFIELDYWQASFTDQADAGKAGIRFLDATDTLISEVYNSLEVIIPYTIFQNRVNLYAIPANTRKVKVLLHGVRAQGTNNDAYFDEIKLRTYTGLPDYTYVGEAKVEVWSERDTWQSFQKVTHTLDIV